MLAYEFVYLCIGLQLINNNQNLKIQHSNHFNILLLMTIVSVYDYWLG